MLGVSVLNIEVKAEKEGEVGERLRRLLGKGEFFRATHDRASGSLFLLVVIEVDVQSVSVEAYQRAAMDRSSAVLVDIAEAEPIIRDLYILSPAVK